MKITKDMIDQMRAAEARHLEAVCEPIEKELDEIIEAAKTCQRYESASIEGYYIGVGYDKFKAEWIAAEEKLKELRTTFAVKMATLLDQ